MSLPSIVKVTLKEGLSNEELHDTFNDISQINGLSGMERSFSHSNVLYCGSDGDATVDEEIKKIPNVVSVTYNPPS